MTLKVNTLLAPTWGISASVAHTVTVCDNFHNSSSVTVFAQNVCAYYQTILGFSSASGDLHRPYDFSNKFRTAIGTGTGNNWTVGVTREGHLTLKSQAHGSIIWTAAGTVVRNILGFTGSTTICPAGVTVTASYQPFSTLFSHCAADDSGWQQSPGMVASAQGADGTVYTLRDGYSLPKRKISFKYFPRDYQTALTRSYDATPFFPSQSLNVVTETTTYNPPYSVWDFIQNSKVGPIAAIFSDNGAGIAGLFDGRTTFWEQVYSTPENNNKSNVGSLSIAGYSLLRNLDNFEMVLRETAITQSFGS